MKTQEYLQKLLDGKTEIFTMRKQGTMHIKCLIAHDGKVIDITYYVAQVCGLRFSQKHYHIMLSGAQYCPCQHVVEILSRRMGLELSYTKI